MIEFEEPDAKYTFDEERSKGGSAKVKVLALLFIFVLLTLFLAKNNYKFNMLDTQIVPVIADCNILYRFDSEDSEVVSIDNAKGVLKENMPKFEELTGFYDGYVASRSELKNEKNVAEIIVEFKDVTETEKSIPKNICGFDVFVVFK
ncbi:MAG: hypothetical protein U9O20_01705 [Patescibacteria group bacterium]|nr:hypothetical protein [Patescibacteria group bacterium]